jgi:hypothetical protein
MPFNYIRVRATDFNDGITATLIPKSATTTLVSSVRFAPVTELPILRFTCSGTSFKAQIARDVTLSGGADINAVPVFVDGAYAGKITATLNATAWFTFSGMSAGNHVVELWGGQAAVSGAASVSAGHILAIAGTSVALAPVVPSRKLLCWGDSIMGANNPGNLGVTDLTGLLRASYPGRVTSESMGSATYTQWSDNTSLIARFARHVAGVASFDILAQLGTNDYGGSLATIQAQLTTQFGLIVAMTGLNKLVVLTPITRGTETINGAGFTLGNYRTQITAAIAAVGSAKIATVDGTALGLNTSTDYIETPAANALHPNDLGTAKILTGVRTALGF